MKWTLALLSLLISVELLTASALGAPVFSTPAPDPVPVESALATAVDLELPPGMEWYAGLMSLLVPVALNWLKARFPLSPQMIVALAPALAAGASTLLNLHSSVTISPVLAALLGFAGVGLFEAAKQVRKLKPHETPEQKRARLQAELAALEVILP